MGPAHGNTEESVKESVHDIQCAIFVPSGEDEPTTDGQLSELIHYAGVDAKHEAMQTAQTFILGEVLKNLLAHNRTSKVTGAKMIVTHTHLEQTHKT